MTEKRRPATIPQHFLRQVESSAAGKVALRQKEYGIWREFSWQESCEQVRMFGLGLLELGLRTRRSRRRHRRQ